MGFSLNLTITIFIYYFSKFIFEYYVPCVVGITYEFFILIEYNILSIYFNSAKRVVKCTTILLIIIKLCTRNFLK